MNFPPLSGSDYFHLLVDRKMLRNGLVGNISRIHLELEASTDLNLIAKQLSENESFQQVSNLKVIFRCPMLPRWGKRDCFVPRNDDKSGVIAKEERLKQSLQIHNRLSDSEFESIILKRKVDNESGLVFIDLCELQDGTKQVVISMHHVLFDHQGMTNFLHVLADKNLSLPLFPEAESTSIWIQLKDAAFMTVYMLSRSSGKLGTLIGKNVKPKSSPKFKIIRFNKEEKANIEASAWKAGSRIGQSAFYMAATAKVVQETLIKRGKISPYLWFSVPHNHRRKGTLGHLVSNQLSFLFFRLKDEDLKSIPNSVSSINAQLKEQLKARIIERYSNMQEALRWVPLFLYEKMVDLASSGKMSSFGYSDLGEMKDPVKHFLGTSVIRMHHYPPVPSPPGFNVVLSKSEGELNFVWAYFDEALSSKEVQEMELSFRKSML